MKIFVAIICISIAFQDVGAKFVLPALNMDARTFQACSYCDARADRAGSRATANALREYMTRNHVAITVDKGDVRVTERFPDENVNTGHSCSVRARAMGVVASVTMLPGTVNLGPQGVVYIDEIQNAIAVGSVKHAFTVNLSIRAYFGAKIFGKCRRIGRKTCSTDGYSEGTNKISVSIQASNVLTECIGGREHLTFNINAKVVDEAIGKTYKPVQVGKKRSCDLRVLKIKIGSMNSVVQGLATKYTNTGKRFNQLRGSRLVGELQKKLGVQLGSTVSIKLNNSNGSPMTCQATGRAASCKGGRKSCPSGFVRVGQTANCQKYNGTRRPSCRGGRVVPRRYGSMTLYWCYMPMV